MFPKDLHRVFSVTIPVLISCSIGFALAGATGHPQTSATLDSQTKKWADEMPDGDGKKLVIARCKNCHTLEKVVTARHDRKDWDTTIQRMIDLGTYLTDDDRRLVTDYLVTNYPPKSDGGAAPSAGAPSGPSK